MRTRSALVITAFLVAAISLPALAQEDGPYALVLMDLPEGLALPPSIHMNLSELATALGIEPPATWRPVCFVETEGNRLEYVLSQFDPDPGFDARANAVGVFSFIPPEGASGRLRVRVYLTEKRPPSPAEAPAPVYDIEQADGRIVMSNKFYRVVHDPQKQAGFPSRFEFKRTGKVFDQFNWNDRVHDKQLGSFHLRGTREPRVELASKGPVRAVVRLTLQYMQGQKTPDSKPSAVYEFSYYPDLPVIGLRADIRQRDAFDWRELHFVEINFPGEDFRQIILSGAAEPTDLVAEKKTFTGKWAALLEGDNTFGLIAPGARIYDGRGEYGTYLHGPWVSWSGLERKFTGCLYVSGEEGAVANMQALAHRVELAAVGTVTTPAFLRQLETLEEQIGKLADEAQRGLYSWALALIERTGHQEKRLAQAIRAAGALAQALDERAADPFQAIQSLFREAGQFHALHNDAIGLGFARDQQGGIRLISLFDFATRREHLASVTDGGLFSIALTNEDGARATLDAGDNWGSCRMASTRRTGRSGKPSRTITWEKPQDEKLAGISVSVSVELDGRRSSWKISVDNASREWGLRTVAFPSVRLRRLDHGDDYCFVPRGSGTLTSSAATALKDFSGTYPSGWCSMQFGGYYDSQGGVYFAAHDPLGSRKTVSFARDDGAIKCLFGWDAPEMGVPGNDFEHPGECVIEVFPGDWFDAAQIYKSWARENAKWWPTGEQEGRPDTPQWMKDVSMWALMSGKPDNVVEPCIKLRQYVGVPTAVHWYSWHQIPFDDDYPHYFPVKEGFAEGVKKLQESGVRVMPYINGRLWDSDTEDFPTVALPAATKNEKGEHYIETYGSKQELVPMCPTTKLWQEKVQEIVLRLVGPEYNVDGVYIDQIGAASPRLCFDKSHGHPLGGGHWWLTQGYWPMLESLQRRLPPGKMITTECNAEPYCKWMDGYLSWHFQYQDQIPLFAAVYGGNVQIFSRAYRGKENLAHCMKAAQSLVFGEQIGWINANTVLNDQEVLGPFIRRLARLRHALLPYLSWGEMARQPTLEGNIPDVTADWAWSGKWLITDTALQRGAWKSSDGKLALIFVNVTDEPLSATLKFDGTDYGFATDARFTITKRTEDGQADTFERPCAFEMKIELPPYDAWAYEIASK